MFTSENIDTKLTSHATPRCPGQCSTDRSDGNPGDREKEKECCINPLKLAIYLVSPPLQVNG